MEYTAILIGCFFVLPITVYLVVKFGMAAYYKSQQNQEKSKHGKKEA